MTQPKPNDRPAQFRSLTNEIILAVGLAVLIVISRWLIDVPNFKPVMAIAMLAGFVFHRQLLGMSAIVLGMLVSDALIGFYDWRIAMVVYACLVCPIAAGMILRRGKKTSLAMSTGVLGFAGLAALNFYVVTTVAVWLCFDWYPASIAGLGTAFLMGLPFLKWSLMGNVLFSALLFGLVAIARRADYFRFRRTIFLRLSTTSNFFRGRGMQIASNPSITNKTIRKSAKK